LQIRQAVVVDMPMEAAAFAKLGCCKSAKINCSHLATLF